MIPCEIEDQSVLEEWLGKRKGQKVHIKVPKKGTREKLVELATQNAEIVLRQDKDERNCRLAGSARSGTSGSL